MRAQTALTGATISQEPGFERVRDLLQQIWRDSDLDGKR
jgi:hypothetical protein